MLSGPVRPVPVSQNHRRFWARKRQRAGSRWFGRVKHLGFRYSTTWCHVLAAHNWNAGIGMLDEVAVIDDAEEEDDEHRYDRDYYWEMNSFMNRISILLRMIATMMTRLLASRR